MITIDLFVALLIFGAIFGGGYLFIHNNNQRKLVRATSVVGQLEAKDIYKEWRAAIHLLERVLDLDSTVPILSDPLRKEIQETITRYLNY